MLSPNNIGFQGTVKADPDRLQDISDIKDFYIRLEP